MPKTTKQATSKPRPVKPYISSDVMVLASVPPEKREALEKMYATSHMAIPRLDKRI